MRCWAAAPRSGLPSQAWGALPACPRQRCDQWTECERLCALTCLSATVCGGLSCPDGHTQDSVRDATCSSYLETVTVDSNSVPR